MKYLLFYFIITVFSFSFELSDSNLDLEIIKGSSMSKEFYLINNSTLEKEYFFNSTEKNIKIIPKGFRLNPFEKKKFQILVNTANKEVGKYYHYLKIKENIKKNPTNNEININKLFKIKQSYTIIN